MSMGDSVSDAIDPMWWEGVLAAASLDDRYEPPELLSSHFERAAADPAVTGLHAQVLRVLAMVSSAMLNAEDWLEPFTPAMQISGKRTVVPADFDADQVALLARIAPLVERESPRVQWRLSKQRRIGLTAAPRKRNVELPHRATRIAMEAPTGPRVDRHCGSRLGCWVLTPVLSRGRERPPTARATSEVPAHDEETAMATRRSNPYARTWKGFVDQTAQHQLTVLHDEGLYRHLRMAAPGTSMWHWEVVTWPGHLSITWDVADGFTFRRIPDMLDFFHLAGPSRNWYADGAPIIDHRYWAEKLAHEQREATREYSAEEFLRHITLTLADRQGDGDIDAARAAELIAEARSHSEDEHTAVSWMSEVFSAVDQDWYDGTDLRDYTAQYLIACYALDATVQAYRQQEAA